LREGVADGKIHFVGNIMIDTLVRLLPAAERRPVLRGLGLEGDGSAPPFVLVTLHRPANVDDAGALAEIASALAALARDVEVLFPVHPRTRERLDGFGLSPALGRCRTLESLGYLDFLALERRASLVITDSGGVQEETTYLGVPCLTVRPNTERPVTIEYGTNALVAARREAILDAAQSRLHGVAARPRRPPLWDGRTAERIADVMAGQPAAATAEQR
jgi:UDP-N-acetylglucosamine 2-epimerase (non-hydrolysing)